MTDKQKIINDELIGEEIEIIDSQNKSLIGLKGEIIDETQNMLTIKTKNNDHKKIIKNQTKIKFTKHNIIINGKTISKKPEERIKIRLKQDE